MGQQLWAGGAGVNPSAPHWAVVPVHVVTLPFWFQSSTTLNVLQVKAGLPALSQQPPAQIDTLKLTQMLEPRAGMAPFGFVPPPERTGPKKIGIDGMKDSQQPVLTGTSTPPLATEPQSVPLA